MSAVVTDSMHKASCETLYVATYAETNEKKELHKQVHTNLCLAPISSHITVQQHLVCGAGTTL